MKRDSFHNLSKYSRILSGFKCLTWTETSPKFIFLKQYKGSQKAPLCAGESTGKGIQAIEQSALLLGDLEDKL